MDEDNYPSIFPLEYMKGCGWRLKHFFFLLILYCYFVLCLGINLFLEETHAIINLNGFFLGENVHKRICMCIR